MPTLMVGSTVYQSRGLLDQVFATLTRYGYTVWMSDKGTVPVLPHRTAFENCLAAVDACDLFLGIITPFYGSGRDGGEPSIFHQEVMRSIERDKPRWFLANHDVVFARQILKQYRDNAGFSFSRTSVMDDVRVIDIYEAAIREGIDLAQRTSNWVQEYANEADLMRFIAAQFENRARIEQFLAERAAQ